MNSHGLQSEVITARRWDCSLQGEESEWKSCCKDGLVQPLGSCRVRCPSPAAFSPRLFQHKAWFEIPHVCTLGDVTGRFLGMLLGNFGMFYCVWLSLLSPWWWPRVVCPRAGEAALRGEPRMQPLQSPALSNHRTGPPPISPSKRKLSMDQGDEELDCENEHVSKMSRMFNPHL